MSPLALRRMCIPLALALLRSMAGTARDGPTIDEPCHYAAGVYYARLGDYRLSPEHPPLAKRWVGFWRRPVRRRRRSANCTKRKSDEREFVQSMACLIQSARADAASGARRHVRLQSLVPPAGAGDVACRRGVMGLGLLAFLAVDPTVGAHRARPAFAPAAIALAMTIREPCLWE